MRMLSETCTRSDDIIIDDSEHTESHTLRIEIFTERERMECVEPVVVYMTAILGTMDDLSHSI